jgi:uncharacterized protein (TIGR02680 family)
MNKMTDRDGTEPKRNRWQMNRAGIFNFWFYEDEEFVLEDGRLILRGANGAGKSVTMQSFIPLVLDGDKRPNRLDPFGSRDRKIEYYLLGDKEEHTDRTGYLWLEFVHPAKNIYKTIGIGLRARRGAQQVGFWGFVLEDGRRINRDFWLYDRVLMLEGQGKYPLDRKGLEEQIGTGGQVVQEQGAYRDLVNRALFGFHDKEAYADLLNLLIQLRSPKLSKDVKPTAIYEVLTQALPPLHEEELRPLSEVLEDLDQISDRLEELKLHRAELEKLARSYDQYNRYLLYQSGEMFLQAQGERDDIGKKMDSVSKELQSVLKEEMDTKSKIEANKRELTETNTKLELLNRSEAMEKQAELDEAERQLRQTESDLAHTQKRLNAALHSREEAEIAAEKARLAQAELLKMQREGLDELEEMAGVMEFYDHSVYARHWEPEPPEDISFLAAWRRDVEVHRHAINEAIQLAEKEQEAGKLVSEYDKQLGAMRMERDQAEAAKRAAAEASEAALYAWKESLLTWKQSLRQLQLTEEAVQSMFAAINELSYENRDVNRVQEPIRREAERKRKELLAAKVELEQHIKGQQEEKEALEAEKRTWEQTREPEPARSSSRIATRSRYGQGEGAPLYEVCEFYDHVPPQQRASVELTLLNSGLLDAWIRPDGRIGELGDADEEAWIVPQPIEWGYTLADILKPTPSAESGLTVEQVETVLRSFAWGEGFSSSAISHEQEKIIVGQDYYRFGALIGKVDQSAHRPQFIGKEARRQFKLAEIARLNEALVRCEENIANLRLRVIEIESALQTIDQELAQFPVQGEVFAELKRSWDVQYEAEKRFMLLLEQENKLADRLRVKHQEWSELKQALIVMTSRWSRLRTLSSLKEASQTISGYLEVLSQLQSDWREYRQRSKEAELYETRAREQGEIAEEEEEVRDDLLNRIHVLRVKIQQLHELMEELGIQNVYEQISSLNSRKQELEKERDLLSQGLTKLAEQIGVLRERQSVLSQQEQAACENLERCKRRFIEEWMLRLVPETEKDDPTDDSPKDWLARCRSIVSELEPTMSRANRDRLSGILQDHFNASKQLLSEYVMEMDISETGRITVASMRDRSRPQKPRTLLSELADIQREQELLLTEKDRELFEEIILRSVGKAIRQRIQRAELWLDTMNELMAERNTSSGLRLQLRWLPKTAQSESELNSDELVELLRRDAHLLHDEEVERLVEHFRSRVQWAKQGAQEEREALRKHIYEVLDYRSWFQFTLWYKKGNDTAYREMTDARFNVLSGGEKAMSMYIPLFAATHSRYADTRDDAPKIISLDEAFAGVDDENIRDLFGLLTEMDFDYMMTSQVLWGTYDTVPKLSICEICRPKDANYVTVLRYRWNGRRLEAVEEEEGNTWSEGRGDDS